MRWGTGKEKVKLGAAPNTITRKEMFADDGPEHRTHDAED